MDRRLLLLDTGSIRELITYQAVHSLGFKTLERDLKLFSGPAAFERFGKYMAPFRKRSTTSSVIVELHYWIRKTETHGRPALWLLVYNEFRKMDLEEQTIRLLEMSREQVTRWGPADCSLLELARRQAPLKPMLVTIHDPLLKECLDADIRAIHLREIVTS